MLALLTSALALAGAQAITPIYSGNCQAPLWSPAGDRLAYEVNDHDRKRVELFVYTPGGGPPQLVHPIRSGALTTGFGEPVRVNHELAWSPAQMATFVYSSASGHADYDLYLDPSSVVALPGSDALLAAPGTDGGPTWSPDGAWIVFTSARTGQGDLYAIDTARPDAAPRRLTRDEDSAELYPAFAPDGRRLAYVAHTPSGDQIHIIEDIRRARPRQLTDWQGIQTRPRWSPDGRLLAFYSNHLDSAQFDLIVMHPEGSARRIASGVVMNTRGPIWTPDSLRILTVADDDDALDPVVMVPVHTPSAARRLPTRTVGNGDLDLVLGADGQLWLAVAAQGRVGDDRRDYKRIFVMPLGSDSPADP